jgi:hypothetical protein
MSTKDAKNLARKARKIAPANFYDFARNIEKAIEALADELDELKSGSQETIKPSRSRAAKWPRPESGSN